MFRQSIRNLQHRSNLRRNCSTLCQSKAAPASLSMGSLALKNATLNPLKTPNVPLVGLELIGTSFGLQPFQLLLNPAAYFANVFALPLGCGQLKECRPSQPKFEFLPFSLFFRNVLMTLCHCWGNVLRPKHAA